jgi:GTP-binding protein
MKPVIALIGRPNVGKSTLFNRLTASRAALVSDFPGLTRDRQYGLGKLGGRPYIVVDTGGLTPEAEGIEALMAAQAMRAVEEADVLLLLVDARAGLTAADEEIVQRLRETGKPLHVVINKSEGLNRDLALSEFASLGISSLYCISAAHGDGVTAMMEDIFGELPEEVGRLHEEEARGIRIAVVGRPNVGKSTLINRILGEERMLTFDQPGTTRDAIFVTFTREGRDYTLIDTAGVRRRARVHEAIEKFSIIKTLQAIEAAHVVLLVLDARQGVGEQDARLLGHVVESGKSLVIAVNKWDGLSADERSAIKSAIDLKLSFIDYASVHYISALHGSGVGELFASIDAAYDAGTKSLSTPMLTRVLQEAVEHHAPPMVHGRRIKLRYAHQGGQHPPVIVIHGSQTEAIPDSYRRYLEGHFRAALGLTGTPIRIELRSGVNPYRRRAATAGRKPGRQRTAGPQRAKDKRPR